MKSLRINPIVLILINIIAPSMYIILNGKYLQYFLLIFASFLLIVMKRFKRLLAFLAIYFSMIGIHSLTLNNPKTQFIGLFFIVLSQAIPCFALASVLISKYNSAELLSALDILRLPRMLVVAVTITLKYLPTFTREFGLIKESMRLRGIEFSWKKPIKSFEYFVVPQLFRCAALAEEVTAAGMVKGIDAPMRRSSFFEEKMESYREEWISRGQTPEAMDEMIRYTSGAMGVAATFIVFALAVIGVFIGYFILRKHFEKKEAEQEGRKYA